jgi:hypothetical protein
VTEKRALFAPIPRAFIYGTQKAKIPNINHKKLNEWHCWLYFQVSIINLRHNTKAAKDFAAHACMIFLQYSTFSFLICYNL